MKKAINLKDGMRLRDQLSKQIRDRGYIIESMRRGERFYTQKQLDGASESVDASRKALTEWYESSGLAAMIRAGEGRAAVRRISPKIVLDELEYVTEMLSIPKKAMEGVRVTIDHNHQSFPSAYKYTPESTQFNAAFKRGSWRVTSVFRARCNGKKEGARITHTDASKAAIIDRLTVIDI